MASTGPVLICGLAALAFWTAIGLPLAQRLFRPPLTLALSPALGWAVHSALALPLYRWIGFTSGTVTLCSLAGLVAALFLLRRSFPDWRGASPFAYALAALLASLPAIAILPKISGDAVALSPAIFDHAKVALVDEMARLGLPPGNPFFQSTPFAYYYLWHFSAAEIALVFGISGWEADTALTAVTAFSSLALMIGLATWIGGRLAGLWIAPLAFAGSLRAVFEFALGTEALDAILQRQTGLAGWLFQSAWAPQHIASATCVLIAVVLIIRLAREPSLLTAGALGLVSASAFQSSVWAGGFSLFGATAPIIACLMLIRVPTTRIMFIVFAIIAGAIAIILCFPFLRDQFANAAARGGGVPITFSPYEVFGISVPENARKLLDLPAYWLLFLSIEFPAIYLPGLASLFAIIRRKMSEGASDVAISFLVVAATGFFIAGYFAINFSDNNDLGWRAALPGILVLIVFTAIGLSHWLTALKPIAAITTLGLFALSLPNSWDLAKEYWNGTPTVSDRAFVATPELWRSVRRHAALNERVAINPFFMEKMTPWSINISWALMSDRASCYAGRDYMTPFTTLSIAEADAVAGTFERVFDGTAQSADLDALKTRYGCRVIVLTPQDGAWPRDPFAANNTFSLAEDNPRWRIYRINN